MALVDIQVPDIGDFDEVGVIELLVKPGDTIKVEQSLITVESDKASMEIPSSHAGQGKELRVQVGDKVKEGSVLLTLEVAGAGGAAGAAPPPPAAAAPHAATAPPPPPPPPLPPWRPRHGPRLPPPGRRPRPAQPPQPFPPSSQARPWPACHMPRRRCASSPANWACPSRKSRARAPRGASRWTTCKPSPGR